MRLIQVVELLLERGRRLAGRRLGEQLLGRGRARARWPVAAARSLASCTNCSLAATGALSQRRSIIAPDLAVRRHVDGDAAGRGGPAGPLLHHLRARLAEQFDRLVGVAAGVLQGLLAVHHGQTGPFAQRLDGGRGNFCHLELPPVVGLSIRYRRWLFSRRRRSIPAHAGAHVPVHASVRATFWSGLGLCTADPRRTPVTTSSGQRWASTASSCAAATAPSACSCFKLPADGLARQHRRRPAASRSTRSSGCCRRCRESADRPRPDRSRCRSAPRW